MQRMRRSKNKPSEGDADSNLVTNKTTDLEALNNASSAPVFDENEAVDDPNDNSLEFDDEGGGLLETNGMDIDEDPMEKL